MKRTMAVILAGGEGERLSILSGVRAKPAVPFGGKYRIIDFTLSNCVNSDIDNVVVLTQYNPRSLNDHIGLGRPWDLDRNRGGVRLLQPHIARGRPAPPPRAPAHHGPPPAPAVASDCSSPTSPAAARPSGTGAPRTPCCTTCRRS